MKKKSKLTKAQRKEAIEYLNRNMEAFEKALRKENPKLPSTPDEWVGSIKTEVVDWTERDSKYPDISKCWNR